MKYTKVIYNINKDVIKQIKKQIQLNFGISNTDISNAMDISKWFVRPKHLNFKNFTLDISNIGYLEVFRQSHLVRDSEVWLCVYIYMYIHVYIGLYIYNVNHMHMLQPPKILVFMWNKTTFLLLHVFICSVSRSMFLFTQVNFTSDPDSSENAVSTFVLPFVVFIPLIFTLCIITLLHWSYFSYSAYQKPLFVHQNIDLIL